MACAMAGSSEIVYPILTEESIVLSIKDYINIPFSIAELRAPTSEKLHTIFGAFVCCLLEVSNEQISQIPLHVMETIGSQDMHIEEGAGYIQFVKILVFFMEQCGINDFDLNDILNPTKKRTRRLLSAIVNYAQYSALFSGPAKVEILTKLEATKKEQEKLIKKRKDIPDKIASLKARQLERQRSVQELNLSAMKAELEEIELLKKEKAINNARTQAEVEELKNSLTIGRSSRLINEGTEAVEICKTRTNAMIVKEELVTKFEEAIPSALRLVKDIEEEAGKCHILTNDLEKAKDRSLELSKSYKTTLAQIQNMESLIKGKVEKKERFNTKTNEMNKLVKDTEQRLLNKKVIVQEDVKKKQDEIRNIREEVENLNKLMCLYGEEHNETMKSLNAKLKSLETQVSEYNDKVLNTYNKFIPV